MKFLILLFLILYTQSFTNSVFITPGMENVKLKVNHGKSVSKDYYLANQVLDCSPALPALISITSKKSLLLLPQQAFEAGQSFQCISNLETLRIMVEDLTLLNQKLHRLKESTQIRVQFNSDIEKSKLEKSLKLTELLKHSESSRKFKIQGPNIGRFFNIITDTNIHHEAKLRLEIENLSSRHSRIERFQIEVGGRNFDSDSPELFITDNPNVFAQDEGKFKLRVYLPHKYSPIDSTLPVKIESSGKEIRASVLKSAYHYGSSGSQIRSNYYLDLAADLEPQSKIKVVLKAGLKSGDFVLKSDREYELVVPDRRAYGKIPDKQSYLSLSHPVISFESSNLEEVKVVLLKLHEENLRYFMQFQNGHKSYAHSMSEEILQETVKIDHPKNSISNLAIHLDDMLLAKKAGVYEVSLYHKNNMLTKRVLFVSDLGLQVYKGQNSFSVWVNRLSNAKQVKAAKVELFNSKNRMIAHGVTDENGLWTVNEEGIGEQDLGGVLVKTSDDQNFLVLKNNLKGTNSPNRYAGDSLKAYLGVPRYLIRPGEKMQLLALLRSDKDQTFEGTQLKLEVRNPARKVVNNLECTLNSLGACSFNFQSFPQDPTGNYSLSLKMGDRKIASQAIKIGSFLPPRIKPELHSPEGIQSSGQSLVLSASCSTYFGTPCKNYKAKISIVSNLYRLTLDQYPGFKFYDHKSQNYKEGARYRIEESFTLDSSGKRDLKLPAYWNGQNAAVLKLDCQISVDDLGRDVNSADSFIYSPAPRITGIKPLFSGTPAENDKLEFESLMLGVKDLKPIQEELIVQTIRLNWQWSFDRNAGESRWHKVEELVEEQSLLSGENYSFTPQSAGDYMVRLIDPVYGHKSQHSFWVSGWSYNQLSPNEKMNQIELKVDSEPVTAGKSLTIHLKSPISGSLLLTIHSKKALFRRVYKLENNSAQIQVTLPNDLDSKGMGYLEIQASVIRPVGSVGEILPMRAYASKSLAIDQSFFELPGELIAPDSSSSNKDLNIKAKIHSDSASQVVFFAIDQSLLDLANRSISNPFHSMKDTRISKSAIYDLYSDLRSKVDKLERMSFGSDAKEKAKIKKHRASELLSKRVKPFSKHSGILTADENGVAQWSFNTEQFQGKVKVFALAYSKNQFALFESDIRVADPVVIKANFPRFLHIGDRVKVPFELINTTDQEQSLELKLVLPKKLGVELNSSSYIIPPKDLVQSHLWLSAKGKGLKEVIMDIGSSKYKVKLPVLEPRHSSSWNQSAVLEDSARLTLPYFVKHNAQNIELKVANDVGAILDGLKEHLLKYPYGCAEQTATQLGALSILNESTGSMAAQQSTAAAFFQMGKHRLIQMLNAQGQFRYWSSGSYINEFASLFAASVILESDSKGQWDIDQLKSSIVSGIKQSLKSVNLTHRLFAEYLLNKYSNGYRSSRSALVELKCETALDWALLAAVARMSFYEDIANQAILGMHSVNEKAHSTSFGSIRRDETWVAILMAEHFPNLDLHLDPRESCLIDLQNNNLRNTQERFHCLKLIAYDRVSGDWSVRLDKLGQTINSAKTFSLKADAFPFDLKLLKGKSSYHLSADFLTSADEQELMNANVDKANLNLSTIVLTEEGKPVTKLELGQNYIVEVQLNSKHVLEDLALVMRSSACAEFMSQERTKQLIEHVKDPKRFQPYGVRLQSWDERDDRQLIFFDLYKNGKIHLGLRAIYEGECKLPMSLVEAMYDSRLKEYDQYLENVRVESK